MCRLQLQALRNSKGIDVVMFDDVRIEPTDSSLKRAIEFAKFGSFDGFVSVGGGSVIDTAKAAVLYSANPEEDFLAFVNPPIGRVRFEASIVIHTYVFYYLF